MGGLIGWNYGTITNSYATGNVTGYHAGGLVGWNYGTITNSYATGNVIGYHAGGLVDYNSYGTITNSYTTGNVTGYYYAGGLVGCNNYGTITNSYATGNVTGYHAGGLVGTNYGPIINSYWNNHAGNPSVCVAKVSGTCAAIQDNESYFYYSSNLPMSSWDFVNVWGIDEGVSYPYLLWQIPPNQPPVADAGTGHTAHIGTLVNLNGSGSYDPDENYPLSYSWQMTSKPPGSEAELFDSDLVNPSFYPDVEGDYTIELVVTDSPGLDSQLSSVVISTYNTPPVADAGADQAVILIGTLIQLDGSQSYDDDGDEITYLWTMIQKPDGSSAELDDPCSPTPTFVADVQGDYVISLVVTDIFGAASLPDNITVSFDNIKPVAVPGDNQAVVEGDTVFLDGSGSYDDNGDELTFSWSVVSRPSNSNAILSASDVADPCFVADANGSYVVSLVVNDGFVNSDPVNLSVMAISDEDAASMEVIEAVGVINALDPDVFKNKNMGGALTNKINAALELIDQGYYIDALEKLQNDVLQKTNGCAESIPPAPDKNDWIKTCEEQEQVYPLILQAIQYLEQALQ